MKDKRPLIVIISIISLLLMVVIYIQFSDYFKKSQEEITHRTNYGATYLLEYVTKTTNPTEVVANIIDYEIAAKFSSIDTKEEILEEFKEKKYIELLDYILLFDDYDQLKNIFTNIRKIIVEVAFYDLGQESIFQKYENDSIEKKISDRIYEYQIKKNVLTQENWHTLMKKYEKERKLNKNYFINLLWNNSMIQAILNQENISYEIWNKDFPTIYKAIYEKIDTYVIQEIDKIIEDFSNMILVKQWYKEIKLETFQTAYQLKWESKIPNYSGLGITYRTSLNLESIFTYFQDKNYPKLYF